MSRLLLTILVALLLSGPLAGCSPDAEPLSAPESTSAASPVTAKPGDGRISLPALARATIAGDRLRIGPVREQTDDYTSYDVTFRSRLTDGRALSGRESLTISGVLNVPTGPGPFPAVVLAHGFIPPQSYVVGQGMTREREALAEAGYTSLHVDYRGHARSDSAPDLTREMRLGYTVDVVAAGRALLASRDVEVDADRLALMGRSMGGGVSMKALVVEPGLFRAASLWGSVSSLDSEVYQHFIAANGLLPQDPAHFHGTPAENPRFWRRVSARPFLDAVTAPVELVHGRVDEVCPPRWAPATLHAMRRAGVDARLHWYPDHHAFGVWFTPAMSRTIDFLDRELDVRR